MIINQVPVRPNSIHLLRTTVLLLILILEIGIAAIILSFGRVYPYLELILNKINQ